jgi:hypothetical protein
LRRYLVFSALGTESDSVQCPDYYALFKAAQVCNCTPWELLEQGIWWREKALIVQSAENEASEQIAAHTR